MTGYPRAQGLAVVLATAAGAAAQQEPKRRELADFGGWLSERWDDEGREAAGTEEA